MNIEDKLAEFEKEFCETRSVAGFELYDIKSPKPTPKQFLGWLRTALEEAQQDALKNQPSPAEVRAAFEEAFEQGRREAEEVAEVSLQVLKTLADGFHEEAEMLRKAREEREAAPQPKTAV